MMLHICLTMTSEGVETSYILFANFWFENIPSSLTYSISKRTETKYYQSALYVLAPWSFSWFSIVMIIFSQINANYNNKWTAVSQTLITPAIEGKLLTGVGCQFYILSFHGCDPSHIYAILIENFKVQFQWPLRLMREAHVLSCKLRQVVYIAFNI